MRIVILPNTVPELREAVLPTELPKTGPVAATASLVLAGSVLLMIVSRGSTVLSCENRR